MKILFAANRGFALWGSRRDLMDVLITHGHRVIIATCRDSYSQALADRGAELAVIDFRRGGFSPLADRQSVSQMKRLYRETRPDLVHHFHAKPIVFGALASRGLPGLKTIATITGLGESLPDSGWRRQLALKAYKFSCQSADFTVFQNQDDRDIFLGNGLVAPHRARLICSSGVDVTRFAPGEGEVKRSGRPRILMMARLLKKKGIAEFIAAARAVKRDFEDSIDFELAGEWDRSHPDALTERDIDELNHDDAVRFIGYCDKPQAWLQGATAFICPSYYREGVPRVVLEACACAVPVIGVDAPGIRDAIVDEETGYLVKPRDSAAIAERIARLLSQPDNASAMGRRARQRILDYFDIHMITRQYLELYADVGVAVPRAGQRHAG